MQAVLVALLSMERIEEISRFFGVGVISAGLYFAVYVALVGVRLHYQIAATVAFTLSFAVSFSLHKYWTFHNTDLAVVWFQLLLYAIKKWTFFGANVVCLHVLVKKWHYRPIPAQIIIGAVGGPLSYLATKLIFL